MYSVVGLAFGLRGRGRTDLGGCPWFFCEGADARTLVVCYFCRWDDVEVHLDLVFVSPERKEAG